MDIIKFWQDVLKQNRQSLYTYFHPIAIIRWHCSNEQFTVQEYIQANCEYPGNWKGEIERIQKIEDTIITVVKVYPVDQTHSFHVVSFLKLESEKIVEMDEYWSDDGIAPEWRRQMNIGKQII